MNEQMKTEINEKGVYTGAICTTGNISVSVLKASQLIGGKEEIAAHKEQLVSTVTANEVEIGSAIIRSRNID